jgi:hypothetical protein
MIINLHLVIKTLTSYNDNYNLYQSVMCGGGNEINALTNMGICCYLDHIIAPAQYGKTINYVSVKLNKEFTFGKFALDNTILYQKSINRITF